MSTSYLACPTAMVEAPIEVVWKLLTNFSGWGDFYDVRVWSVEPPGGAAVGQRMRGNAGPRWLPMKVVFEFTRIDKLQHKLEMDIRIPFGIKVHEDLDCVPLGPERCRVNYHCHFDFPEGWRGRLLRKLLNRGLSAGPLDSILRLKRAAEKKFGESQPAPDRAVRTS